MKSKIHRCNCRKIWSIQNRKTKITAKSILLIGEWDTEVKPERKYHPKGFVITNISQNIIINPPMDLVNQYIKVRRLIFDKEKIHFNVSYGQYLFFSEEGSCFILREITKD